MWQTKFESFMDWWVDWLIYLPLTFVDRLIKIKILRAILFIPAILLSFITTFIFGIIFLLFLMIDGIIWFAEN